MNTIFLFIRSLPRLFKNARRDMSRHLPMILSSILSVAVTLLLAMVMSILSINAAHFAQSVEGDLQIQLSLSPALSEEQIESLQKRVEGLEGVSQVEFSSRENELESLIREYGDSFEQYRESNPLYDVFYITFSDPLLLNEVSGELENMSGVVEVSNGGDSVMKLIDVFESIGLIAWAVIIGLAVLGIFLIRNTISMTISLRKDEITIMRHVGAYDFYISMPFILQGLIIGFWGSLFPCLICDGAYLLLYYGFSGAFISQAFELYAPYPFLLWINLAVFAAGLILGAFGSYLAVRKTTRSVR